MTREVVLVAWCDVCDADGEQTPGRPHEIAGVGPSPVEIDLCERHEVEIGLASVSSALAKFGRSARPVREAAPSNVPGRKRAGRKPSTPDYHGCPFCSARYSGSGTGLRLHLREVHGFLSDGSTTGLAKRFGERCPLCGEPAKYLARHCDKEHGQSWGDCYRAALAAGDPFGLCAPVAASVER